MNSFFCRFQNWNLCCNCSNSMNSLNFIFFQMSSSHDFVIVVTLVILWALFSVDFKTEAYVVIVVTLWILWTWFFFRWGVQIFCNCSNSNYFMNFKIFFLDFVYSKLRITVYFVIVVILVIVVTLWILWNWHFFLQIKTSGLL